MFQNIVIIYLCLLENWVGNEGKGVYAWLNVGCTGVNTVRSPLGTEGVPGFGEGVPELPVVWLTTVAALAFVLSVFVVSVFVAEKV